jgi:SPP1 family phage portal protein
MYTIPKDSVITSEEIKKAIKYNENTLKETYQKLDDYYEGDHEIMKRAKADALKNNRVVVNHASYITDINVGYLLGNPVEYQAEKGVDIDPILEAYKKQTIRDLDHELAINTSIMGKSFEYVYATEESEPRSAFIDPRNCIVLYDDTVAHKKVAAITYTRANVTKGKEAYEGVVVYTMDEIAQYDEELKIVQVDQHSFGGVPIIEHKNNSRDKGDFAKVISLIDAYNTLQSDRVNDKEQLVEALLILYGIKVTPTMLKQLKENRVMSVGNKNEGTGAEYLVKALNETDVDVLRQNIESDIHKISMTPNLSDENFVGNSSGVAIRYKLIAFEQSVKNKERYLEKGLKERIVLYSTYLNKLNKGVKIVEPHKVDAVFKRNLPQNDFETSQMLLNLSDFVDQETLLGQVSFIQDVQEVMKKKAEERAEAVEKMIEEFGRDPVNDEDNSDVNDDE